jgi:DNA-binding LacI/PurR family transcriptional regulator
MTTQSKRKKTPLFLHIYGDLRQKILSGKFPAGKFLPGENSLCSTYDASRFTVRTALKKLDAEHLVQNQPGRGWMTLDKNLEIHKKISGILGFIGRNDTESISVLDAIEKTFHNFFSDFKYFPQQNNKNEFLPLLKKIEKAKIAALIIFNDSPLSAKFAKSLSALQIPFICMPLNGSYDYDSIGTDNFTASQTMLNYLYAQGHRNIIFATSEKLDLIPSFYLRKTGYCAFMEMKKLKPEIIFAEHNYWQGPEEEEILMTKIRAMKLNKRMPTCIFCSSPVGAFEILAILKRNSISVPGEISICSFGTPPQNSISALNSQIRSITHLEEQFDKMATHAVKVLSEKRIDSHPVSILFPAKIQEGNSVINLKKSNN